MTLISTLQSSVLVDPASRPDQPNSATWLLAIFFVPFAAWVLWTSWQWRKERHHHLH
jgi:hypothetical protein